MKTIFYNNVVERPEKQMKGLNEWWCMPAGYTPSLIKFVGMPMIVLVRKARIFLFFWSFLFSAGATFAQSDSAIYFSKKVSSEELRSDLTWLSSPALMGRGTPSGGLDEAADFIRDKFQNAGLLPFVPDYLQKFYWPKDTVLPRMDIGKHSYRFGIDYYTNFSGSMKKLTARQIILVSENVRSWPDSGQSFSGAVLVMSSGKIFSSVPPSEDWNILIEKAEASGAAALLIPREEEFGNQKYGHKVELNSELNLPAGSGKKMPVIFVHFRVITDLLGNEQRHFISSKPEQPIRINRKFKMIFKKTEIVKPVYNVAGYIPGRDSGSYIIIGAHYDHLGEKDGEIYSGADDNASGTAALLQMARVFSMVYKEGFIPEKNLLFVAFSAEEEGLIGSKFFVSEMPSGMKTDAMINMDMIGRRDDIQPQSAGYIYVMGQDYNPEFWKKILKRAGNLMPDLKPDFTFNRNNDPEFLIQRSDQYPFLLKGIPVLFFYDDMQSDYHSTGDISAKIDWPLLERRTQFIFLIGWQLAFPGNG